MDDFHEATVTPGELAERREELAELRGLERLTVSPRWSARQGEAACVVALRGGGALYVDVSLRGEEAAHHARAACLVREVAALLSGKPVGSFFVDTARRPWRVIVKDRAAGMVGRLEATLLGRGLLRVLPNICRSTYLYVEGSAVRPGPRR